MDTYIETRGGRLVSGTINQHRASRLDIPLIKSQVESIVTGRLLMLTTDRRYPVEDPVTT